MESNLLQLVQECGEHAEAAHQVGDFRMAARLYRRALLLLSLVPEEVTSREVKENPSVHD
jgi:hypothetical protein